MKYPAYRIDAKRPVRVELNGRKYRLTLYFDRVIRFYDLLKDSESKLTYADKLETAYHWFTPTRPHAPVTEKIAVVMKIYDEYIKDPRSDNRSDRKTRTAVNFITDSPYIYAAFRQYYGIDLFKAQGKLLWWEFLAMFDSLPPECKMKEIMQIRTRPLPAPTQYNAEERIRLLEQRDYYFLEENWQEVTDEADNMLAGLFDELAEKWG